MGAELAVVQAAYRQFEDGVRRWRDVDLADWLGRETPAQIREQIEAERAGQVRLYPPMEGEQAW